MIARMLRTCCLVMSHSLWSYGRQHARLLCPSLSPRVYSNLCPLSWWCYLTISTSIVPLSFCFQSFPSGYLPVSLLFSLDGQKYWSFGFSISPSSEYSELISFRIDCLDFLAGQGTLKSLLQHHSLKASVIGAQPILLYSSHILTWLLEKP